MSALVEFREHVTKPRRDTHKDSSTRKGGTGSRPEVALAMRNARTAKKPATATLVVGTVRRSGQAARPKIDKARLRELIEEATADAYGEDEQRVGFLTMIQDHLEVPFETEILGV